MDVMEGPMHPSVSYSGKLMPACGRQAVEGSAGIALAASWPRAPRPGHVGRSTNRARPDRGGRRSSDPRAQ